MANVNQKIVRAPKVAGDTKDSVRVSLLENFEGFRIAGLFDRGDQWEALLEKPLDKISSRVRVAEFPPVKKEEPSDESGDSEESEESEPSDGDEGGEESGEEKGEKPFGGGDEKDPKSQTEGGGNPIQEAVHLLKELEKVFKGLADGHKALQDVHKAISPHVSPDGMGGPDAARTPEDIGPAMPGADTPPVPGMPGELDPDLPPGEDRALKSAPKPPPVPRRPQPAQGFDRRRKTPGMPMGFSNTQHKVVSHPINDGTRRYSISEAISGLNIDPRYAAYRVESITEDTSMNRYVAKLALK